MKHLNKYFEGLLDADFDGPNIDIDPIEANIPLGISGELWQDDVDRINSLIEPFKFYSRLNELLDTAQQLAKDMKGIKVDRNSEVNKLISWAEDSWHLKSLNMDTLEDPRISKIRALNDWIGKANKNSELKKLIKALDADVSWSLHEINNRTLGKTVYGYISWFFISPNDAMKKQLEDLAGKLSKLQPDVPVRFSTNVDGDAFLRAYITKI